jgi:hypothetical protein
MIAILKQFGYCAQCPSIHSIIPFIASQASVYIHLLLTSYSSRYTYYYNTVYLLLITHSYDMATQLSHTSPPSQYYWYDICPLSYLCHQWLSYLFIHSIY